ncbi:MAG: hypothetical protein ABI162_08155 [Luteolibacter sp.]
MKTYIPYSLLAALAACGMASGASTAYTTPVGYVTESILASQYNVVGLTLQSPVARAGTIDVVSGTVLTDNGASFGTLAAGTYVLEINSGALVGAIQEITTFSGDTITTPQDLSATLVAGTTYSLRPAATFNSVFGAANSAGLLAGSATTADIIWVPSGSGFSKYYYTNAAPPFVTAGWKNTSTGNTDQGNAPIVYTDGIMIQRRAATNLSLVISGEVKVTKTMLTVDQSYTYVGGVYPAGSTLGNSGLKDFVLKGSITTGDVLWVPNGTGGSNKYYYTLAAPPFVSEGWKRSDTGNTDQSNAPITSGYFIQRRAPSAYNALITPPTSYAN